MPKTTDSRTFVEVLAQHKMDRRFQDGRGARDAREGGRDSRSERVEILAESVGERGISEMRETGIQRRGERITPPASIAKLIQGGRKGTLPG